MKRAETLIYGVLLLVTLGAAWMVRNAEEPAEESGTVVFDPGAAGVTAMKWEDETSVATIEVSGKGDDLTTWVVAGKKEKIETPVESAGDDDDSAGDDDDSAGDDDDSAGGETTQPAKPKVEVTYGEPKLRRFPGNATAKKLVESFSPLEALRSFDQLDADALSEMGLDEPKGSLTVESGSGSVTFAIGDKAYGSSDTYVRIDGKDAVFLVSSKDLSPLRGAENRLIERVLVDAEEADLTAATLLIGGQPSGPKRVHSGRHDKNNSFWAAADAPEDKDTVFGGFMEKALGLRVSSFPADDEVPEEGSVESVFRLQLEVDGGPAQTLELGKRLDADKSTDDEDVYSWFARSTRTRDRWAVISKATGGDLADLLAEVAE